MRKLSRPVRWAIGVAAGLVVVAGVLVVGFLLLIFLFNPVADEHACSEGEAPANHVDGGSSCFPEEADLPAGYTWDPRGNFEM